jgi:hypothetical protein
MIGVGKQTQQTKENPIASLWGSRTSETRLPIFSSFKIHYDKSNIDECIKTLTDCLDSNGSRNKSHLFFQDKDGNENREAFQLALSISKDGGELGGLASKLIKSYLQSKQGYFCNRDHQREQAYVSLLDIISTETEETKIASTKVVAENLGYFYAEQGHDQNVQGNHEGFFRNLAKHESGKVFLSLLEDSGFNEINRDLRSSCKDLNATYDGGEHDLAIKNTIDQDKALIKASSTRFGAVVSWLTGKHLPEIKASNKEENEFIQALGYSTEAGDSKFSFQIESFVRDLQNITSDDDVTGKTRNKAFRDVITAFHLIGFRIADTKAKTLEGKKNSKKAKQEIKELEDTRKNLAKLIQHSSKIDTTGKTQELIRNLFDSEVETAFFLSTGMTYLVANKAIEGQTRETCNEFIKAFGKNSCSTDGKAIQSFQDIQNLSEKTKRDTDALAIEISEDLLANLSESRAFEHSFEDFNLSSDVTNYTPTTPPDLRRKAIFDHSKKINQAFFDLELAKDEFRTLLDQPSNHYIRDNWNLFYKEPLDNIFTSPKLKIYGIDSFKQQLESKRVKTSAVMSDLEQRVADGKLGANLGTLMQADRKDLRW